MNEEAGHGLIVLQDLACIVGLADLFIVYIGDIDEIHQALCMCL